MINVSQNLRYLLWRLKIDRNKWAEQLSDWVGCSLDRAKELLKEGKLRPQELSRIADMTHISEEEIQNASLIEEMGERILRENIAFLSREWGDKRKMAEAMKVREITISRWCNGKQRPPRSKLDDICRYFGLPIGTSLETQPLFLSIVPVSDQEKKRWLKERIDEMNPDTLQEIFPALRRLIGDV